MTVVDVVWPRANVDGRFYDRPRQAVILAGGRGERMRPITDDRPKPMVPVLGRPFLEYQIEQLRDQGFERVLLLLGYLPEVVQNHFGDGSRFGLRIDYSVTAPEQQTSSRVSAARHMIDPCFLLLYCDNYWPMQMQKLWARFCRAGKPALITVYANKDGYSRGGVRLDENQDVKVFDRRRAAPGLREVEISYAILTDRALDLLPEDDIPFEEAVYTALADQGRLAAFVSDHRYYSIGSLDRLPTTEAFFRRRPAILLDRDGVLNRRPPPAQYVRSWSDWAWLPGARESLRLLRGANYRSIIASNQPGIARGFMSEADLESIHRRMKAEALEAGGRIDGIYYCPHDWDEGCDCRKPRPGLLYRAQRDFHLDLTRTPFVGDEDRDAGAASAADCPFFRVSETQSLFDIVNRLLEPKGELTHAQQSTDPDHRS